MARWTLDNISWDQFDSSKVTLNFIELVKAAALVEYNGDDYAAYLINVFKDDEAFCDVIRGWAIEEVRHGQALARWAQLADPNFDFAGAVARFRAGYRIDMEANRSVRGSRSGELVARCMVETGTSSYYTALAEASGEPVLKEICRRIAADEFRHYKMFYDHLMRHLKRDRLGRLARFRILVGRILESGDDELAYAYYAANHDGRDYDRNRYSNAFAKRAYPLYRRNHIERGVAMALKTVGLPPQGRLGQWLSKLAFWQLQRKARSLSVA